MTIKLNAATGGGSVSLSAPNSTTSNLDVELTLPVDDGAANTFLKSDGSGTLSWAAASSDSITEGNTTVECVDTGSDGHITFDTEGSEAARFDSSQRLLVGTSSARTNLDFYGTAQTPQVQIEGGTNNATLLSLIANSTTDSVSGQLRFAKSSASGIGNNGAVVNNEVLGRINFSGSTGSTFYGGAEIIAACDGTPSTRVPTRLMFYTGGDTTDPTQRMRITSEGYVGIGASARLDQGGIFVRPNASTGAAEISWNRADTAGTSYILTFYNNSSAVGYISHNNTTTTYSTSSDYRLKENVVPLTGAADRVNQLQVHRFNFIADPDKTVDGFIAHEAQAVVPECVTGTHNEVEVWKEGEELPDGVSVGDSKLDEDGNTIPVYQGIDQSKLVPLLTAALQEALAKIETLETANASLEARLTALEGGAS